MRGAGFSRYCAPSSSRSLILLVNKLRPMRWVTIAALGLLLVPLCNSYAAGVDAPDPFVHPPTLERDVRFWIRVYTEVTTDQGLLHDDWNLGLVYEVLRFDPAASPAQRERRVAEAKARYASLLRRFAAGAIEEITKPEESHLPALGEKATPGDFCRGNGGVHLRLRDGERIS